MTNKAIDSRLFIANVRDTPKFGDNVVGTLNQCDAVEVTGAQVGDRWLPCLVTLEGREREVFISKNVLRDQVSTTRERLLRVCVKQWLRFDRGQAKEHHSPYYKFVGEFWQSISLNLDGKDRDVPWSAAFISFCVRTAKGYDGFKFAAAHSKYAHQAIRRKQDEVDGPFWGFRISEHKPQLGDMVCRSRAGSGVTYDFAKNNDAFKSHCDIIVRITKDHVVTLGGNVRHSVSKTNYALNSRGLLIDDGKIYAVLKNNR
ncbi:MAG: DUF2272 domain-containing protein [Bacteroidetes bacterium]|nr:DUF2272 domain-containing protein [Bacteroidota bacterium]